MIRELIPYRTTKPLAPNGHHVTVTVTFEWLPLGDEGPRLLSEDFGFRGGDDVGLYAKGLVEQGKLPREALKELENLAAAVGTAGQGTIQEIVHPPVFPIEKMQK